MHDSPPRFGGDDDDDYDEGHDAHDDLAALDFSAPRSDESTLDALDGYAVRRSDDDRIDLEGGQDGGAHHDGPGYGGAGYEDPDPDADDDGPMVPTFTVTNPPGTVSVTTFFDGRVRHIELSPKVNTLSEVSLAEEIMVIAGLATQDARAGQFSVMLEGLRLQGHDGVAMRDFLQHDLDLPTPEQVAEDRAAVFEQRYGGLR